MEKLFGDASDIRWETINKGVFGIFLGGRRKPGQSRTYTSLFFKIFLSSDLINSLEEIYFGFNLTRAPALH